MSEQFFKIDTIAERLEVSRDTVRKWVKDRRFKIYKFGGSVRISMNDIMKFAKVLPSREQIVKKIIEEE